MKQKISIKSTSGSTAGSFNILSCWQVNNEILVLLENNSAAGGGDIVCEVERHIEVITTAEDELPVKCYIINNRNNRIFNTHRYMGTLPRDGSQFHFLLSVYDFNKLVAGGKLLAKRATEIFDLRTLIRVENADDANIKASDIYAKPETIVSRLLEQNPLSNAILEIMIKAQILNGDPIDGLNIIGNLISGMQKLSVADQKKMLQLYSLLAGGDGGECLLTGYIHDVITDDVFGRIDYNLCGLDGYLQFMLDLQPLNAKMVNAIFLDARGYLDLHQFIGKFDNTFQCERYFFDAVNDPVKSSKLADLIQNNLYDCKADEQPFPWMTKELFKLVVDHIDDCYSVTSGLGTLHRYGMLESYQDKFMNNLPAAHVFGLFIRRDIMKAEHLLPALENKRFPEVELFFQKLDYTGQWSYRADKAVINEMLAAILHDVDLTAAVCDLSHIYKVKNDEFFAQNKRGINHQQSEDFKAPFKQELGELIAASKIKPQPKTMLQGSPLPSTLTNLFSPQPALTLAEKVEQMKAKYGFDKMPPAAVVETQALKW